jgi:pimeloyl-ACP methyl ester carboxylesterase
VCDAVGCRGLVYSRPGYGRSTPTRAEEAWGLDFMHRQAHEVLPALLAALGIDTRSRPWLFGHSDGGSIALLYAARFPPGAMVLAPHILVEDLSVASIEQARQAYETTDLRQRLARHHDDPDSAFWGWNRIWLHPPFRQWSIEAEIAAITARCWRCRAGRRIRHAGADPGHRRAACRTRGCWSCPTAATPHRDQPQAVVDAVQNFIQTHGDTP